MLFRFAYDLSFDDLEVYISYFKPYFFVHVSYDT
jgi:hypothetical protein